MLSQTLDNWSTEGKVWDKVTAKQTSGKKRVLQCLLCLEI